jgi:outer membrane protein TolC
VNSKHSEKTEDNRVSRNRFRYALLAGVSLLVLSACALTPEPLTPEEQVTRALTDRAAMFANQEAITAPITLEQAMARAVKYDLQHRLSLMQRALEDNLLDLHTLDLLPRLAANAGYSSRSNEAAASSRSVSTGLTSLEPSTSQDQSSATANLQLSWNVLDFGISYFGAKSQANRILAAEERRKATVVTILQQVRAAYWNAVTADRLRPEVTRVLAAAKEALTQAQQTGEQRLAPPLQTLIYQRDLVQIVQQLEALESDLAIAKAQLGELMNLPPGTDYQLAPADGEFAVPRVPYGLTDLEAAAMVARPEINEEAYLARNIALDTRVALLRLLPGATLFGGLNSDSNSFLVNNNWANAGVQVSYNLLNVLGIPRTQAVSEAQTAVGDIRREALRMAVLTQVNVAYHRYERANLLFQRYALLQQIEGGIAGITRAAAQNDARTRLEAIRADAASLLATRARDRSYAELQDAYGAIYQATGISPLRGDIPDGSVQAVAAQIAQANRDLETGTLRLPTLGPAVNSKDEATPPVASNAAPLAPDEFKPDAVFASVRATAQVPRAADKLAVDKVAATGDRGAAVAMTCTISWMRPRRPPTCTRTEKKDDLKAPPVSLARVP